jgi:hemerythrin-like domain-containing protein
MAPGPGAACPEEAILTLDDPSSSPPAAVQRTPTQLLSAEHRVIEQVLGCLEKIAGRADGGDFDTDAAGQVVDFLSTFADRWHHAKEEAQLFPMLESHGLPSHMGPTSVMRSEHEQGRGFVRGMAAALDAHAGGDETARARYCSAARGFVVLLTEHIMKEDGVLFPMADQMIPPVKQAELLAAFGRVEKDGLGEGTGEKYLAIAAELGERYGVPRTEEPAGPGSGCVGTCGGPH